MSWPADTLPRFKPTGPYERDLACVRCRDTVTVAELPAPFLNPALYVCGACLQPKETDGRT